MYTLAPADYRMVQIRGYEYSVPYRSRYRPAERIKTLHPRSAINNAFRFSHSSVQGRAGPARGKHPFAGRPSSVSYPARSRPFRDATNRITHRCTTAPPVTTAAKPPSSVACPALGADGLQSRGRTVLSTCCGQSTEPR